MKRKPARKPSKGRTSAIRLVFIYIGLCLLILLPGIIGIVVLKPQPECANSESCIKDLSGKFDESQKTGIFLGKSVVVPGQLPEPGAISNVLGDSTAPKIIKIDLANQRLYAYEGDRLVYNFLVSTGKWGRTPTGTFDIWVKLRATRMSGGSVADGSYYNLPNVQYTMFFYNKDVAKSVGYSIHGAYWHNNFGHPMSHGCINMKTEEAALLYAWADPPSTAHTTYAKKDIPGTKVEITGVAPRQ